MNFEPCIRYFDDLGLAKVYVRISHKRKVGYIKTRFIANKSQVDGTRVKDMNLLALIIPLIQEWANMLNSTTLEDVNDIIVFLTSGNEPSFTEFSKEYILTQSKKGRFKSMMNYRTALTSFQEFMGKKEISFSEISSKLIDKWIDSLSETKRAKQSYPNCIKKLFNEGKLEYNDYDNNIIRIKNDPFKKVVIPPADSTPHRALSLAEIKAVFSFDTSLVSKDTRAALGKDVAMIVFYLAGINTVDLYYMKRENLTDWKLIYNRRKTSKRNDGARMEIVVPEIVRPLFEKYQGEDYLFDFYKRYSNADNFSSNINEGLRAIGSALNIGRVTIYSFRHSWATIARNDCDIPLEDVGFCLNHVSAHKITDGYIKKDFSKVDVINSKVIEKVSELHSPDTPTNSIINPIKNGILFHILFGVSKVSVSCF